MTTALATHSDTHIHFGTTDRQRTAQDFTRRACEIARACLSGIFDENAMELVKMKKK